MVISIEIQKQAESDSIQGEHSMKGIKIEDQIVPCFGKGNKGCRILHQKICPKKCVFYKPKGCRDWIRVERDGEVWVIPPEEYYAEPAEER